MKLLKELQEALKNGDTEKAKQIADALEKTGKKPKRRIAKRPRKQAVEKVADVDLINTVKSPKIAVKSGDIKSDNKKLVRLGDIIPSDPHEKQINRERAKAAAKFKMASPRQANEFSLKKIACKKCREKFNPNSYVDNTLNKTLCKNCQMDS